MGWNKDKQQVEDRGGSCDCGGKRVVLSAL